MAAKKAAEERARKAEEERVAHRQEIVDFAMQFEGNPYVYGGTSLTNGADCSGFMMSVFKEFGYELPRVAAVSYTHLELINVQGSISRRIYCNSSRIPSRERMEVIKQGRKSLK